MRPDEIPAVQPRPKSSPLLRRSLQLWSSYIAVSTLCAAVAVLNLVVIAFSGNADLGFAAIWVVMACGTGWFAYACTRPRNRMRRAWTNGERVEVTVLESSQTRSYWHETVVDYNGRRAEVNFRYMPDRGMKLVALVLDDSIAVLEPMGRLRIGWLSGARK